MNYLPIKTLRSRDCNLFRYNNIRHTDLYSLNEKFKRQQKDKEDVIQKLEKEVEEKSRKEIELDTKIKQIEKLNEKNANEINTKHNQQMNDIKKKQSAIMEDK